jgi:hypothetical protein
LHAHLLLDPQSLRRFRQEAEAASRILHPNAIKLIDIGDSPHGQPFIVMEFIDGVSLSDYLSHVSRLRFSAAISIFIQICGALEEAHRYGVVHRDIKPSNIMLQKTAAGPLTVKVVDFGIAKIMPQKDDGTFVETSTGKLIGSPPYMSPEQCLGERVDLRSDIYSTGCVMYETITGVPPFVGITPIDTMYRQIHSAAAPLSNLPEDIRLIQRMDQIIARTLQKSPSGRYQTVAELRKDLSSLTEDADKSLRPVAFLQLKLNAIIRKCTAVVGTSKVFVICIASLVVVTVAVASCLLIPYMVVPVPTAAQKRIDWQAVPMPSGTSYAANYSTTAKREALEKEIKKGSDIETSNDPDLIYLEEKLADLYFYDETYPEAAATYDTVLRLSQKLFLKNYANYQPTPAIVHTLAQASERSAECELHLKHYRKALQLAQSGLKWAFSDTNKNDDYKAFFCYVQGIATAKLGGPDLVVNENCDNFIRYAEIKGLKSDHIGKIASAASNIANCELEAGKWKRALVALITARKAWTLYENQEDSSSAINAPKSPEARFYVVHEKIVRHTGLFNVAVSYLKEAEVYKKLEQKEKSFKCLEEAATAFESAFGENDPNRAKVLFLEADHLWAGGQKVKAWLTRVEAIKIWSASAKIRNEKT